PEANPRPRSRTDPVTSARTVRRRPIEGRRRLVGAGVVDVADVGGAADDVEGVEDVDDAGAHRAIDALDAGVQHGVVDAPLALSLRPLRPELVRPVVLAVAERVVAEARADGATLLIAAAGGGGRLVDGVLAVVGHAAAAVSEQEGQRAERQHREARGRAAAGLAVDHGVSPGLSNITSASRSPRR